MINGELSVFFCWLICHLTPMLLIVSKQGWCHFEALKLWNVSFIWTLKNFTPAISWLTINKIQRFRAYGIIAKCNQNNLDFTFKRMNVTWSHNSLKKNSNFKTREITILERFESARFFDNSYFPFVFLNEE